MVWAGFSASGKTALAFTTARMNAKGYQNILKEYLLPFRQNFSVLQQDNAPPHVARSTKAFFDAESVEVIDWPSRSPDLNPIENIWAILVRDIYADGMQFFSISDLKEAILKAWDKISQKTLARLSESMDSRIVELIEKRGGRIHY